MGVKRRCKLFLTIIIGFRVRWRLNINDISFKTLSNENSYKLQEIFTKEELQNTLIGIIKPNNFNFIHLEMKDNFILLLKSISLFGLRMEHNKQCPHKIAKRLSKIKYKLGIKGSSGM